MSTYELMELRATHIQVANQFFRFWITFTFALIAAAYVVGPGLGWFVGIGILVLYLVAVVANDRSFRSALKTLVGLEKDLEAGSTDHTSEAVLETLSVSSAALPPMALWIQLLGSAGASGYLIYRIAGGA